MRTLLAAVAATVMLATPLALASSADAAGRGKPPCVGDRHQYCPQPTPQPPVVIPPTPTGERHLVLGSRGPDRLVGTAGNDLAYGFGGNDRIFGLGGNDRLYGNSGADRLWGQAGNDVLIGGYGNDFLVGGSGFDRMYGGPGYDICVGSATDQFVNCERRIIV